MASSRITDPYFIKKISIPAAALLSALITLIAYLPALRNEFVNWDDYMYVYDNPVIRTIDLNFLKLIFTTPLASNWHPLTMLSYAVDYSLWGLDPWGYHLVNIVFHALNTFLVALLTATVLGYRETDGKKVFVASALAALLFGLHPQHVESVAWISERKDVLYAFFFLLACIFYLRHARGGARRDFYAALFFFAVSIMCKPMAITLPAVLLIFDFYPLGRLTRENLKTVLIEKAPFFAISALSAVLTLHAQRQAMTAMEILGFQDRLLMAMRAFAFYLYKTVLPIDLAPFYPFPFPEDIGFFKPHYIASFFLLALITAFCVLTFRKRRYFTAAWLYYLITLLPVIGIIQVGSQAAADRYTYLTTLSVFMLASAGAVYLLEALFKRYFAFAAAALVASAVAITPLTLRQTAVWKDSLTLWDYQDSLYTHPLPYSLRGAAYARAGDLETALEYFGKAIAYDGGLGFKNTALFNRAVALMRFGRFEEAVEDLSYAIILNPATRNALHYRGDAHRILGDYPKAIEDYQRALALTPGKPVIHYNLGLAYLGAGDNGLAVEHIKKAAESGHKEAVDYLVSEGLY